MIRVLDEIARKTQPSVGGRPGTAKIDIQQQMDNFASAAAQRVYVPLK